MAWKRSVLVVLVVAFVGVAGAQQLELSKDLAYGVYTEKLGRVELTVGSYLARLEEAEKYVPFQIALGVWDNGPELTISPDNFELHDANGNVYQAATPKEVAGTGINQMIDAWVKQQPLNTGNLFTNSALTASNFYPLVSAPFTDVHLDRATYFRDVLYFPKPEAGLDGTMILSFYTQGMKQGALNVVFQAPKMKKKHKKQAGKIRKDQAD